MVKPWLIRGCVVLLALQILLCSRTSMAADETVTREVYDTQALPSILPLLAEQAGLALGANIFDNAVFFERLPDIKKELGRMQGTYWS